MSINQFPQNDGPVKGSVEKKKKTSYGPYEPYFTMLLLVATVVALGSAPAIVIGAWRFFL